MSERQGFLVRNGLLATGGLVIVALLVIFYATVSGAVDRAAQHHAEALANSRISTTASSTTIAPKRLASLSTGSN